MRASNGKSTAASVAMPTAISQTTQATAARREATRSILLQQHAAQVCASWVGGTVTADQIARDVGVGQLEKLHEGGTFSACRLWVPFAQVSQQQQVQLFHAATAAPFQFADFNVGIGAHGSVS